MQFLFFYLGRYMMKKDIVDSNVRMTDEERLAKVANDKRKNIFLLTTLSIIGILAFLLIWQLAVMYKLVPEKFVPAPTSVVNLFITKLSDPNPDGAVLGTHILASLQVALTGFGLAIVIGVPLGLTMGWFKGFDSFMRPLFEILRPIPPVSWIPITIMWLGLGLKAKAFIVFFSAFVPCVINAYTGIKQTPEALINVGKTCGASNFVIFWRIGIPSALTMTFAGIRVALGNSWATLVAAEMLAANAGLGYMIQQGRQFARPDLIILGIVVIGILGVLFTWILGQVEGKVLGWKK